jgi:hypothetical protein
MPSHLHLIAGTNGISTLSEILRDFKKFPSKVFIKHIQDEPESSRAWMLRFFENAGKPLKRIEQYKFWQDGNQAKEIIRVKNPPSEKVDLKG